MLIRLHGCTGWSAILLFAYGKNRFSHDVAQLYMSLITRKPVFRVGDQGRLKLAYTATEARQGLEILDIASIDITLSKQWTTKAVIRLHRCAGSSAPSLFAYGKNRFSHYEAQIVYYVNHQQINWSHNAKSTMVPSKSIICSLSMAKLSSTCKNSIPATEMNACCLLPLRK